VPSDLFRRTCVHWPAHLCVRVLHLIFWAHHWTDVKIVRDNSNCNSIVENCCAVTASVENGYKFQPLISHSSIAIQWGKSCSRLQVKKNHALHQPAYIFTIWICIFDVRPCRVCFRATVLVYEYHDSQIYKYSNRMSAIDDSTPVGGVISRVGY
jgi:hypothetical protein